MTTTVIRTISRSLKTSTLSLRNFKGIKRAEVELNGLTVLLGANSSGKTTISQSLILLSSANRDRSHTTSLNMTEMSLGLFEDALNSAAKEGDHFEIGMSDTFESEDGVDEAETLNLKFAKPINSPSYATVVHKREEYSGLVLISSELRNLGLELRTRFGQFNRAFIEIDKASQQLNELRLEISELSRRTSAIRLMPENYLEQIFMNCFFANTREDRTETLKNKRSEDIESGEFSKRFAEELEKISEHVFDEIQLEQLSDALEKNVWPKDVGKAIELPTKALAREHILGSETLKNQMLELAAGARSVAEFKKRALLYLQDIPIYWMHGLEYPTRARDLSLSYLGPLRNRSLSATPQDHSATQISPLGVDGRMLSRVLQQEFNKLDNREFRGTSGRVDTIESALQDWLQFFGMPAFIKLEESEFGHSLRVGDSKDGPFRRVDQYGTGLSQLLPVIAITLLAEEDSLVVIEQPELHLHPLAQRKLADFFMVMSSERRLLVETHSEYLVTRIRRNAAVGSLKSGEIPAPVVYFAEKSTVHGSQVTKAPVDSSGSDLDWPQSFSDFGEQDKLEIFESFD